MKRSLLLASIAFVSLTSTLNADPVKTGDPAPLVKGTDQEGNVVSFADIYKKGTTLVYFYPKAGTPGCTAEACSLRDAYSDITNKGVQIIGVSRDGKEALEKFHIQYKLPFTLVTDDGSISTAFGVPSTLGFDSRQSFIVKDGKVVWESLHAKTGTAAQEVQTALASLK
jgi:peroxiredoxin Q/BCP